MPIHLAAAMGQKMSQSVCCSSREKNDRTSIVQNRQAQFECFEAEVGVDAPRFFTFGPLWGSDLNNKRIALAGRDEVHVYRVLKGADGQMADQPFQLQHTLRLGSDQEVTAIIFTEETTSRQLAVAVQSEDGKACVRIWPVLQVGERSTASDPDSPSAGDEWNFDEGYLCSLDGHRCRIDCLALNTSYLFSADRSGECRVWHKRSYMEKNCQPRSVAKLHRDGVLDLCADRVYIYSVGREDRRVCVWSVPDLSGILAVPVEIPQAILASLSTACPGPEGFSAARAKEASDILPVNETEPVPVMDFFPEEDLAPQTLLRVTALRRPLSRWAGSQNNARSLKPRGTLYAAGVLALGAKRGTSNTGSGVLMEWSLGPQPRCQNALVAHDSPITCLVFGPYDNGPLVTADATGIFRVWDCVPRLVCSQEITVTVKASAEPVMSVEPQVCLYSSVGDRRLFVWRWRWEPSDSLPEGGH